MSDCVKPHASLCFIVLTYICGYVLRHTFVEPVDIVAAADLVRVTRPGIPSLRPIPGKSTIRT